MNANGIIKIRKRLGLTQQELADLLGVNRVSLARWETGERRPSRMAERFLKHLLKEKREHGPKEGS